MNENSRTRGFQRKWYQADSSVMAGCRACSRFLTETEKDRIRYAVLNIEKPARPLLKENKGKSGWIPIRFVMHQKLYRIPPLT